MNNQTYLDSGILLLRLHNLVKDDAECLRYLLRLGERIHILNLENLQSIGDTLEQHVQQPRPPLSLEELQEFREVLFDSVKLMAKGLKSVEDKQSRQSDREAAFDDYVQALKEQNAEMFEELRKSGADISKFSPIPRPPE